MACSAALLLSACGDPLAGVERVSQSGLELPSQDATLGVAAAPESEADRAGLFAGLFARRAPTASEDTAALPAQTDAAVQPVAADSSVVQRRRGGFLGGLFSAAPELETPPPFETVSLTPEVPQSAGLFGGLFAPRGIAQGAGLDTGTVTAGTVLPFGDIARVCDVSVRDMGKVVEHAGTGRTRFTLHDSVPDSTAPRTFYVTGFADGCARQFTAALALFGDPAMHEKLRYGLPSETYPYSTTDKAYEKVKSAVCAVPRRSPCGPRIDALSRNTVFISAYERFTDNGRWADILLHDGAVLAAALKNL